MRHPVSRSICSCLSEMYLPIDKSGGGIFDPLASTLSEISSEFTSCQETLNLFSASHSKSAWKKPENIDLGLQILWHYLENQVHPNRLISNIF